MTLEALSDRSESWDHEFRNPDKILMRNDQFWGRIGNSSFSCSNMQKSGLKRSSSNRWIL